MIDAVQNCTWNYSHYYETLDCLYDIAWCIQKWEDSQIHLDKADTEELKERYKADVRKYDCLLLGFYTHYLQMVQDRKATPDDFTAWKETIKRTAARKL